MCRTLMQPYGAYPARMQQSTCNTHDSVFAKRVLHSLRNSSCQSTSMKMKKRCTYMSGRVDEPAQPYRAALLVRLYSRLPKEASLGPFARRRQRRMAVLMSSMLCVTLALAFVLGRPREEVFGRRIEIFLCFFIYFLFYFF